MRRTLPRHPASIDGILVCLPNFGDEKGVADSIRLSELQVPILVQACPDDLDQFGLERRRDAFCGKISACNNLRQYGFKYSLTRDHTVGILEDRFREDLGIPRGMSNRPRSPARSNWRSRRQAKRV